MKITPKKKFKWVTFEPQEEFQLCFWTHKPELRHGIWGKWNEKRSSFETMQIRSDGLIHNMKPLEIRRINK